MAEQIVNLHRSTENRPIIDTDREEKDPMMNHLSLFFSTMAVSTMSADAATG